MQTILENLFLRVIGVGLRLRISGAGNLDGQEGFYGSEEGKIEIFVSTARNWVDAENARAIALASPDPLFEILILAHEFGHYLSKTSGVRPAKYEQLRFVSPQIWPQLSTSDKMIILDEELAAWRHAKTILEALDFDDWRSFEKKQAEALVEYRRRLELGSSGG